VEPVTEWSVFPNPATDLVQVQYVLEESSPVQLNCLNAMGQVLQTQEFSVRSSGTHHTAFDLSSLPGGLYQIQITTQKGTSTKSVVKQ
jgi:uncharacterized protein YfaS (alpha-2-macroglobulin family)